MAQHWESSLAQNLVPSWALDWEQHLASHSVMSWALHWALHLDLYSVKNWVGNLVTRSAPHLVQDCQLGKSWALH